MRKTVFSFLGLLAACGGDAGTFTVRFAFRDAAPEPNEMYLASAHVEHDVRGRPITVAEAPSVAFAPDARLHFDAVPNGDGYIVVVELHEPTAAHTRPTFFGRSKPFSLRAGEHIEVAVELALQRAPDGEVGAVRIVEANVVEGVGRYLRQRSVTLALAPTAASAVTIANDAELTRGAMTRALNELSTKDEYRWLDWDLDAEICDEPPCPDGRREVYVRFENSAGYQSAVFHTDAIMDTASPELSTYRLEPHSVADGAAASLLVIAREPLLREPELQVWPGDFAMTLDSTRSEATPGGLSFTYGYTVDARAADRRTYGFSAHLVDLAGNEADVMLDDTARLEIASELYAVSTAIERTPAFGPFARKSTFSRTDAVTGEPVTARVTVISSVAYDALAKPRLSGHDGSGHRLDFAFLAGESDESRAVFSHTFAPHEVGGSYELRLDWRDRAGRAGQSKALRIIELRDAPTAASWGALDTGLNEAGEPRTLYTARPWGAQTARGHRVLGDSLTGRVIQRARNSEDCIAQLLLYGDASTEGEPRPASLLDVVSVNGETASGCKTDSSTFSATFSGHNDYHLYVVPVSASGYRGLAQAVVHGEWVATLPNGVSGGTAAQPHRVLAHLRVPRAPLQPSVYPAMLPAVSTELPFGGSWERRSMDSTTPRIFGGAFMAYDANHAKTFVATFEALWQWDGSTWSEAPASPSAAAPFQTGPVAYDTARDRLVLVGGGHWSPRDEQDGSTLIERNETWEWDGVRWTQQHPPHAPAEDPGTIAYDPARQRVVSPEACGPRIWEWDGTDWAEGASLPNDGSCVQGLAYDSTHQCLVALTVSETGTRTFEHVDGRWEERAVMHPPPVLAGTLMTYDSAGKRVILYGGEYNVVDVASRSASTWEWDGVDWSLVASAERPLHECYGLVEHGADGGVSLFCGAREISEHWRLAPTGWTNIARSVAPKARSNPAMSYDERRKRAVLFGGYSTLSDAPASETWEYDGTVWLERVVDRATAMTFGAYGPQQSMTYDAARGVSLFLGQLVEFERGPSPLGAAGSETLVFDGSRWQSVAHNATFVSRTSYGITYDSARERAIVFGGTADDGRGALGDTWEWDGSGWEQRTSAASPQPRAQHALAYDVARQRTVLFGGEPQRQNGASGLLNDTWEWDGDAWTELHPGASPPPRTRHALVYDQARRRTVLFGGAARADGQEGGALGDTWEWDGVTWTQQTAVVSPRARAGHVMVYDSTRKRVLLFGGDDNGSFGDEEAQFANLWEWDGSTWVEVAVDPFPSARQNPSLAFDPDRQHVVMFGGLSYNSPQDPFGDTWVWDGDRWSQRRISPAPTPRGSAAFGSDPDSRTLLLYGGMDGVAGLSDTWAWDGTTWSQKLGARAAADVQPGMMYDAASARLILVADGQTFSWQNESWQALSGVAHLDNLLGIGALSYDRGRSRGLLLAIQETPDRVGEFAYEWDGLGWRSLDGWSAPNVIEGGLAYDTHRRGLLRVDYSNADQYNTLCAVEGTALRPLAAPGNPAVANPAIVYDEERRQLLLVGNQFGDSANAAIQTWLWSELEPAQEIVVDLKPLFGTSRRHDVSVDGLAFRAVTGATAAFGGALASGAALEIWTGSAFVRAQRNEATFDSPGALCFESADPATLGGLEVDKQWPFLLRAAADADGPEPAQLRTSAFEVRARFHIGNAAPALPQAKHSFGKTCDPGGWAMRDLPAGG